MTPQQVIAHEERMARGKKAAVAAGAAEIETGRDGLHQQIMDFCNSQWPRWKFIHSRTDQKSTVEIGSHDFTIFLPSGRWLLIECKAKHGKLSPGQRVWAYELAALGHVVYVVYSLGEFKRLALLP